MKYKHGDYIALAWEDWCPDALFVRGHVTPEAAEKAIRDNHGDDIRFDPPVRAWARWSCEPGPDGCGQVLRDYDEPGRGRFAVMRANVLAKQVDRHSWNERREGSRFDRQTRTTMPNTRPGEECDCSDCLHDRCVCGGDCACHWSPRGAQPAWFRLSASGDASEAGDR